MSRSVWGYGGVFQQYWLCALVAVLQLPWCLTCVSPAVAEELPRAGTVFRARDTLDTSADGLQDAQQCLEGLRWKPADFEVRLEVPRDNEGDLLVRFPSPVSSGNGINDLVSMEWYAARDKDRRPCAADCVIVVHESGRGMTVGRIFARGLNAQGLHTFLIHLPGYGARRTPDAERAEKMLDGLKQAVADVRRARDAAASLPLISGRVFGVQGTSLGGFVTSTAGVFMSVLYALQRFSFPALATAIFNLGIVVAAPLLAPRIGIFSLAAGLLVGSAAQLLLMYSDVRRAGVLVLSPLHWRHPALRRILWLYLPIAVGLAVSLFQVGLDRRLASGVGEQSIAWMANATTLQQMPLGLISVAISLAALPQLSQYYAAGDEVGYRRTLGRGLRMLWMLVLPAGVLFWLLGEPITRLLFQRGAFTATDTEQVVAALNIYLIGMLFAAVDYPLNFAFYARFNTWLPALVGVVSVGIYILVARALIEPLGYLGLVWADTAKQAGHALIMGFLLWRVVGRLGAETWRGFLAVALAGGAMALGTVGAAALVVPWLPSGATGTLLRVVLLGSAGFVIYAVLLAALKLPEARSAAAALHHRFAFGRRTA